MSIYRSWIFDVLVSSTDLATHVGNRIFQASSMGIDPAEPTPKTPFLIYRVGMASPNIKHKAKTFPVYIYLHDQQGSYLNHIEPAIEVIKKEFVARTPEVFNEKQVYEANWREDSEDLYDDMFRTATKYTTIDVTVSS